MPRVGAGEGEGAGVGEGEGAGAGVGRQQPSSRCVLAPYLPSTSTFPSPPPLPPTHTHASKPLPDQEAPDTEGMEQNAALTTKRRRAGAEGDANAVRKPRAAATQQLRTYTGDDESGEVRPSLPLLSRLSFYHLPSRHLTTHPLLPSPGAIVRR